MGGSGRARFNILRARGDIGTGSTIGVLYTGRDMTDGSGAFNRVVSADVRLLLGGRYALTTQVAGSVDRLDMDSQSTGFSPLIMASIDRSGREFTWNVTFTDIHPDFRARSGFITRAGDTQVDARMTVNRFGPPGDRILVDVSTDSSTCGFLKEFWCREIRKALSEVDGIVLMCHSCHLTDDGLFVPEN